MKKRLLMVLLCAIMVMALLPVIALEAEDISSTGLNLVTAPNVKTVYKAGDGTVTWDPTVTPATLTFDGATINVASSAPAVTVEGGVDGVNVVFKGVNNIKVMCEGVATVFKCKCKTTITLLPGSDTTLNAGDGQTYIAQGIFMNSDKFSDPLVINGSGKLTVDARSSEPFGTAYAIVPDSSFARPVFLNGGTLVFTGKVFGDIILGGVTIPSGSSLILDESGSCTKGENGAVINGELHLEHDLSLESINALGLSGTGKVVAESNKQYICVDDEWIPLLKNDVSNGLDLSTAPTAKTAYEVGKGTVVWSPTMTGDPAEVTAGTLTLNNAQMCLDSSETESFFTLPDVPVKIELNGKSTLSTQDYGNSANFFTSTNSVELTGTGSVASSTAGYFIDANTGSVTLDGGTRTGRIKAGTANLTDVTIPDNYQLDLTQVTGAVNATNVVNNGTLVLKRADDTTAEIAMVEALDLTGSGYVKATEWTSNYYTNDGTLLQFIAGVMDFSKSPEMGSWSSSATAEESGYNFSGDSTNGYTLKLGNFIMETDEPCPCITLPGDGPVNVILEDDAITRIINYGSCAMAIFKTGEETYPCTITGNGKLVLVSYGPDSCLKTQQPLTIAGGNIRIVNHFIPVDDIPGIGIFAEDTSLTISGGIVGIEASDSAVIAKSFTLNNVAIIDPVGAAFNSEEESICDADGNVVPAIKTEPIVVDSVVVNPASVTIKREGTQSFSATVIGKNNPSQTVNWEVLGGVGGTGGTYISADGVLYVSTKETSTTLTVKATSTSDITKTGTATVTVENPHATVSSVVVTPAGASVLTGTKQTFHAAVTGTNNPNNIVEWHIDGNSSSYTHIDENGELNVAWDETATTITVKATSTVDNTTFGTTTVSIKTPAFTFTPVAGSYTGTQSVTISYEIATATIRYTLDGSEPTAASLTYSGAISITKTTTVTAKAFIHDVGASEMASAAYTITVEEPSPVTIYNDPSQPDATIWLSGMGLSTDDLLITERAPSGSAYQKLLNLADTSDVIDTYNIRLRSGQKTSINPMNLTFDLGGTYADSDFTLVHQKDDGTYEYFYDTADASGDLTFGPLYELSPFMLVRGHLAEVPATGEDSQLVLWLGIALLSGAGLGVSILSATKKRHHG